MPYQWDFGTIFRKWDALLTGTLSSLELTFWCIILAIPLGLAIGLMRMSGFWPLQIVGRIFVDFFRTSAVLVLMLWFYFALPVLAGVEISPFEAALLAIGLQSAAYFSEIFRGAVSSISQQQWEAAAALGIHRLHALRYVILPQAIRRMIPVSFNLLITIFKSTSIAAAIAFGELTYQASIMTSSTYRPIETYTVVAFIYVVIITTCSFLVRYLEDRFSIERLGR
ncbi:amino acid ABC transporter permease [Phyllobacterium sp. YR531]|uniref:amino acid ABC transporter permease n=1 Tax=Phyllobacterium sp. YR531 TaxID=1144343 RepID=UPI00026FB1C8|nr:amino acid ABC transporter permease [Phyllobacterium sp. YR531]EJN06725.1 amine acid ABC transporter, permease protein, 3-TM region, His/Glu/Gln/Arg/opine family [Phyllobacterium sp. YR531]